MDYLKFATVKAVLASDAEAGRGVLTHVNQRLHGELSQAGALVSLYGAVF